ncbi:MAG: hypothetical protein M3Y40_08505, partial [Chloroflexota bacterium]|nr:hypothetical protein [Chloroflexota bacterium]
PGVPDEVLRPRSTWPDPEAYDAKAQELAAMFVENFAAYADGVYPEVRDAGPRVDPGVTAPAARPSPHEAPSD